MKILILNWRDINHPQAGGSELYFHEMAKIWIKNGHKVFWIAGGWKNCKKRENLEGIEVTRIGQKTSLYLLAPFAYLKLKESPDVILDVENGFPFFSPFFSRKKIILHIHHIHKEVWPREFNPPISTIGNFLESKLMPLVYSKKKIITISKSSHDEILKEYSLESKIVNPGTNFYKIKKFKKNKKPTLLFLNRIKKYKGILTLLKAIEVLNSKKIKVELLVGGQGDYLQEIKSYAKKKRLENVSFLGYIKENKKQELMQKAWIFVNPSSKEGWGIVNIEANYFSTPVIGSDVGGIRDSVVDGETGLLFKQENHIELAKKIELLLKDKLLREKMGERGRKWANSFSWETSADKYLEEIKQL